MHGANAPLMKVYPALKHLFWHEAVNYKYHFQIMCPKRFENNVKVMVAQEVAKERAVLAGQGERREIPLQVSKL